MGGSKSAKLSAMQAFGVDAERLDFEALLPEAMEWLRRMVAINSFTAHREGVNRLGALTAEFFRELGFEEESVDSECAAYGKHLFLTRGSAEGKPVVLVSHLDTVYPEEEELRNGFGWMEVPSEGRIYGPGTVDIKGGTVLIWMLLKVLQKRYPAGFERVRWMVALNASEEVMGRDFGRLVAERCTDGARAVLVFEGGPREGEILHLVSSRKGRAEYRIRVQGRGAHAGSCHAEGVNAVVGLASVIQEAAAVTDYARGLTVNVGRVSGGTVVNRVPHEAELALEMRAFDPEVFGEGRRQIEAIGGETEKRSGCRVEVDCQGISPAWPVSEASRAVLGHWLEAGRELGLVLREVSRGGLSDANYLHALGPTLDGLGPCGGHAHCSERSADGSRLPEYVEPASFVTKGHLNFRAIRRLLSEELVLGEPVTEVQ
jgi:glutamate carboxypeptidase